MSDTSLNKIIQYGTNAAMMAFTPSPASGSQVLYLWEDTDNPGDLYMWDGAAWVLSGSGGGITQLTGDVTAGPGSGSQAATIPAATVTEAQQNITDNTTGNVTSSAHGYAPKSPGDATKFLNGSATPAWSTPVKAIQKLSFTIDGGGSAISSTGLQKYFSFPCTGTITGVRLLGDQSGSTVVDIWKDTWANRPPTNADSITASAKPTLSSAQFYEDTTLTGWTTSVTAGDLGGIEIESISTLTWLVVELFILPS